MKVRHKWRLAGGICLAAALLMVLMSGSVMRPGISRWVLVVWWGVFVLLLGAALWIAMIDLRFTRLEFKGRERALFRETFMSDAFQAELRAAREKERGNGDDRKDS